MSWHHMHLAEIDQHIYEKWQEKEDKYDEINASTSSLFGESESLRSSVNAGLRDIGSAFQNGAYVPNMQAPWRGDIDQQLEKAMLKRLPEIMENLSNKSISEMTPSELEQYTMAVDLILSGKVSEKDMTLVIHAFYNESVMGQRSRKETAAELAAYIEQYIRTKAKYGLASKEEIQRGMLMQAALNLSSVSELGDVSYKDGVYTFDYVSATDVSYWGGGVTGTEKHTVEVGPVRIGYDGTDKADQDGDRLLGDLIGFSVGDKVKETIAGQIKNKITEIIVEKAGSKALEKGFIVTDIIIDWAEDYGTAITAEKIASLDDCGLALSNLDLNYVSAVDGGVENYQNRIYPTANTQNLINEFNKRLDSENQISYEEAINDPIGVAEKLRTLGDTKGIKDEISDNLKKEGKWTNLY